MYIVVSIFLIYALGIIAFELNIYFHLFLAVFVILLYKSLLNKKYIYNIVIITFLALSFFTCYYNANSNLTQYINEDIEVIAEIKTKNKINPNSRYYSLNASVIKIKGNKMNYKENTIIYINKDIDVKENSIIKFNGRVTDPSTSNNHMLFNYKNYLRSMKIQATIFANSDITVLEEKYSFLNNISNNFRDYTTNLLFNRLNNKNAEIILSVILGDINYLDEDFYNNVKSIGLAHIFAVSGTHIGLLYAFFLYIFRLIGFNIRISWLLTWSLMWFYGFLIGFPLSVIRTLIMFTFLFGSEILYRKYNSLNSIAMAALIMTIYNPFWIFEAGFLLSFSSALSFIIYGKYILRYMKTKKTILKYINRFMFLYIFTLPVVAYFFNYIPLLGIFYNLLLLPLFMVMLIKSFVLIILNGIVPYFMIIPFKVFDYFLYSFRYMINLTNKIPFNGISIPTLPIPLVIFFYIFIFFMLYLYNNKNSNCRKYFFTSFFLFYFFTYIVVPMFDSSIYFNFIDVGQGLFSTISYKNYNFIIDCGSTSNKDIGRYTVIPYLTKNGVNSIDCVFISHWDMDHYSGLIDLLESDIGVDKIFSTESNKDINANIKILKKDDNLIIDDKVKIKVIWPIENYVANSRNNTSMVILFRYYDKNILITGDIESEVEYMILNDLEQSDIMTIPHHGSKTSSTKDLIDAVRPKFAVVSYGKNNYGIPSEEALKRYKEVNSIILSTFEHGEINFILNKDKIYYNTYSGEKSDNYYELYFIWIIPKVILFILLLTWIIGYKKEEYYELQNYFRFN